MDNSYFGKPCLDVCKPTQIVNINMAINSIEEIAILDECSNPYDNENLEFAYSLDSVCWSCYMDYMTFITNTLNLGTDFYIRVKVSGEVSNVLLNGNPFYDYSTSIATGFKFSYCSNLTSSNSNQYNPYINMECAIALQQQLTEMVACTVGIPCYYFKLAPNTGSKDITFKEYALMDVDSVKQIKLIIQDNQMPSSKPEFNDWGLDWQSDWQTEISKGMFATAFGPTAQPQEGDLIYIPMMKRMWMVNEAYEEKKDAFMWNATTFTVTLVKYQEKDSVNLGDTEELVNSFVKNKYEDLFGDNENIGSGEESVKAVLNNPENLYPVFETDSTRKYINTECLEFKETQTYFKGTMISEDIYDFNSYTKGNIIYQRKYCGTEGTFSFIITPKSGNLDSTLLSVGNIKIKIKQRKDKTTLTLINIPNMSLDLIPNETYFVYLRFSRDMNTSEFFGAKYIHADIPIYKLQNHHYWYDIDNGERKVSSYSVEMTVDTKSDVILSSFEGSITNIKIYEIYVDSISEILQMYPTNSHLLINDTARKIVELNGISHT